jgi:hypothetical protein
MTVPRAPRVHAVDGLAVMALMAVALLGLDDTYATRSYLVVGLLGATAPLLVAFSVRSRGHGPALHLLVSAVAFAPLGAVIAVRGLEDPGPPTLATMSEVLTGALTGANTLLTTIPPVDPGGPVLVLTWTIGYVLGGTAAWPASRRGWPPGPVLPLTLALVVVILLGSQSPASLLLRSTAFTAIALWWIAIRAERTTGVRHAARGGVLRSLTAAGLVAAVVAVVGQTVGGTVATEETSQRTVLRGLVGRGADVSAADDPLSGLRRYRVKGVADSSYDVRLLTVEGLPADEPLRIVTLDAYDGVRWAPGNDTVPDRSDDLFQRIASQVGTEQRGRPVRVSVEVLAGYRSSWLPLAGALRRLAFDFLDGRTQVEDIRYNPATSSAYVVGGLGRRDDYTFEAVLDSRTVTAASEPYPTRGPLQPSGAFLDRLLRPWRSSGLTPMQQVFSLAQYLEENGRYSNGATPEEARYGPGHDAERLGREFFGAPVIVGDEEQYVAFFALASNRLGVPARVVVGAWPTDAGVVRGQDVAAWVEVRVAGGGWRRIPTRTFLADEPVAEDEPPRVPPEDYLDRDEPEQEQPQEDPGSQQPTDPTTTGEDGSGRPPWLSWALAAVLAFVVPAAKAARRALRRHGSAYRRALGGWRELLDTARDLGRPVPPELTRPSQAERLGLDPDVARQADDVAYAVEPPGDAASAAVWDATALAGSALVAQAPWPRRVWRWWNPASLLTGTRRLLRARLTG